jgi:hypothetical protein
MMKSLIVKSVMTGSLLVTAGVLFPATSSAAATASCGSGYDFLQSYAIKGLDSGATGGYVSVYYNNSTGKNCAIAKPISAWAGKVSNLDVQLDTATYPGFVDDGLDANYHYYAGPIYISARGQCIDVGGYFAYAGQRYAVTKWDVHCG